jgi:hypothetical protein
MFTPLMALTIFSLSEVLISVALNISSSVKALFKKNIKKKIYKDLSYNNLIFHLFLPDQLKQLKLILVAVPILMLSEKFPYFQLKY